jgi:hypothetical protein
VKSKSNALKGWQVVLTFLMLAITSVMTALVISTPWD